MNQRFIILHRWKCKPLCSCDTKKACNISKFREVYLNSKNSIEMQIGFRGESTRASIGLNSTINRIMYLELERL